MNNPVQLRFYEPLPSRTRLDVLDLNPEVTQMTVSTVRQGGEQTIALGFALPDREYRGIFGGAMPPTTRYAPMGHVELWSGQQELFQGRVTDDAGRGFNAEQLVITGYGISAANDMESTQTGGTSLTAEQLLRLVMPRIAPHIQLAGSEHFTDPEGVYTLTGMRYYTLAQMLEQIVAIGGVVEVDGVDTYVTWDAGVWTQTASRARELWLEPRLLTTGPDYRIPLDGTVSWSRSFGELWGTASVMRTTASSETVDTANTNPAFADLYRGLNRSTVIQGGQITQAQALVLRDVFLNEHQYPKVAATVTRNASRGIERYGGGSTPAHLVKAQGWVQVGEWRPMPIIRTEWDAFSGEVSIELGEPAPGATHNWMSTNETIRRHAYRRTNPRTGARQ